MEFGEKMHLTKYTIERALYTLQQLLLWKYIVFVKTNNESNKKFCA